MVIINNGLSEGFKRAAAELFMAALGEKFIPILGDETKATALLESSIHTDYCLSAMEGNQLLGLLAITNQDGSFIDPTFKDMKVHYGGLGGTIRSGGLALLDHKTESGELYIEGIAVAAHARGKGVGTKLINQVFSLAVAEGFTRVTLQVINTNPRAQQLYERLGFKVEKREKIWPVNRIIGWDFEEVIYMAYEIG